MKVNFIDILRYEPNFYEKVTARTAELLKNGHFVGGPVVAEFETAIKDYTQTAFTLGCANGTDAIQLALRAAGVDKNDKVLLPDMTFWATFEAIVNVGAIPYTIDVSKETLHLTLASVKEGIEKFNPKAILLVHLYGWACPETMEIRNYCREKNVILVEDCAQAIGVKIKGEDILKNALVATTSYYPAKVLGASGDAGGVFTTEQKIADTTKILLNHGRTGHYDHGMIGWNSRLGAYEATFLVESLKHLDARLESRRHVCAEYRKKITNPALKFLQPSADVVENGYLSVALMTPETRPAFIEYLKKNEIGYGTVYPGAMSAQPGAAAHLGGKISHGHAEWIAKSIINLPCFAYMKQEEIDYVIEKVNQFKA
ncbi:MAG: aminotransferase class I/II-fold pyridoxal phosphate-dependent enzyme [Bacteriovoracaceae bacterium]|nr:aminotransferase class I/II-fold pyridoxal phosphate-dependent enzyme [Bacteriovoracaceae bacterium]